MDEIKSNSLCTKFGEALLPKHSSDCYGPPIVGNKFNILSGLPKCIRNGRAKAVKAVKAAATATATAATAAAAPATAALKSIRSLFTR